MESFGIGHDKIEKWSKAFSWAAITIILVLLIVYMIMCLIYKGMKLSETSEGFVGSGMADTYRTLTSGSTMRVGAQEFSGTNQEDRSTPMIPEIKELLPGVMDGGVRSVENLAGGREPPRFYQVGNVLDSYRRNTRAEEEVMARREQERARIAAAEQAAAEAEHMGNPAQQIQDELLRQQLYQ